MRIKPFTKNETVVRVVMACASVAMLISAVFLILDRSQIRLVLFACIQGFGSLLLLWAAFSRMIITRIKHGKDVSVFRVQARNILLGVGLIPLVAVFCFIMELLST